MRWQSDSSQIKKWTTLRYTYTHTRLYSASCTSFNSTTLALLQKYVWGISKISYKSKTLMTKI